MTKYVITHTLTCQHCGAQYQRSLAQLRVRPSRFCSKACFFAAKRKQKQLVCEQCGRAFSRKASQVRTSRSFCSKFCYEASRTVKPGGYIKRAGRHIHRAVAEAKLGRKLRPGEIAHHADEDKQNNAPANLEVLPNQSEHARLHFTGKRQSAEQVRKRVEARRRTLARKANAQTTPQ